MERREATSLPFASRVVILDEIGAVLIDGIISQVHADIILGRETTLGARRKETSPALFWDLTWPPGLREMERKRMSWQNRKLEECPEAWSLKNSSSS